MPKLYPVIEMNVKECGHIHAQISAYSSCKFQMLLDNMLLSTHFLKFLLSVTSFLHEKFHFTAVRKVIVSLTA